MGVPHWIARPTILFAAAYLLNGVLHEVAHAAAAMALGIPSVLLHYRLDVRPEDAAPWQLAVIAAAGPVASGVFATLCALAYRNGPGRPGQLALLYLAALGATLFFGNMMSEVGDFARIEEALDMPYSARVAMTLMGFVGLVAILTLAGREMRAWFDGVSRPVGIAAFIVAPALVGTALATLVSQPMPEPFSVARFIEGAVWIVAAIAAWNARPRRSGKVATRWSVLDAVLVAASVLAVRGLVRGVILVP